MSTAEKIISAAEAKSLFSDLQSFPALLLAVSGGPDSTALLWLVARWRDALKRPPKLIAITVDHGLRQESKAEAVAVARLARKLKVVHRTLQWRGRKPASGLQQAARAARYRLLSDDAKKFGASHILTAHTLDDQAETVLIRMSRGSHRLGRWRGFHRCPGMRRASSSARCSTPKSRLLATLRAAKIRLPTTRQPRPALHPRAAARTDAATGAGPDARRLAAGGDWASGHCHRSRR